MSYSDDAMKVVVSRAEALAEAISKCNEPGGRVRLTERLLRYVHGDETADAYRALASPGAPPTPATPPEGPLCSRALDFGARCVLPAGHDWGCSPLVDVRAPAREYGDEKTLRLLGELDAAMAMRRAHAPPVVLEGSGPDDFRVPRAPTSPTETRGDEMTSADIEAIAFLEKHRDEIEGGAETGRPVCEAGRPLNPAAQQAPCGTCSGRGVVGKVCEPCGGRGLYGSRGTSTGCGFCGCTGRLLPTGEENYPCPACTPQRGREP